MHSGNSNLSVKHPAVSIGIGIASLVLEGRLIASEDDDDENFKAIHDFHGGNGPGLSGANGKSAIDPPIVSDNGSSVARHHGILKDVTERISVKLQQLRQCPGTSKEIIETTIAVPTNAHGDENRGTESGVHVRTNENRYPGIQNRRLFVYNSSAAPSSTSSAAKSILHEIDVDWNDTTVLYNGLEKINITSSPIKMALPPSLRSSVVPDRFKMTKKKLEKSASNGSMASNNTVGPKQGPHCQQFLKNIGIAKDDGGDHLCNHLNSYCRRWQFYLRRVGNILMKGDDTCIEVYLGPENNAILLEQWTFNLTNKPSQSTMTIQSLCSAIRSQLYFSQISSWTDLLKSTSSNSGPEEGAMKHMPFYYNREIMENPRLKKNLDTMEVHLDIFFLIKSFDGQANFNDKPNVHQFPDAKISDNLAIRVCLKSLPRLDKIPTLNTNKANLNGFSCDYRIKTGIQQRGGSPLAGSPTTAGGVLNDRMGYASCHEKGKHQCINDVDEDVELMGSDSNPNSPTTTSPSISSEQLVSESSSESQDSQPSNAAQSHREKQLAKFKKLQMKRYKKKKAESGDEEKPTEKAESNNKNEFNYPPALSINATQSPLYATSPPIHANLPQNPISKTMSDEYSEMAEDNNNINNNNNFDCEKSNCRTETATTNKAENPESTSTTSTTTTTTTNRTLSIATQTDDPLVLFNQHNHHSAMMMNAKSCDKCGNQMQCWNCDKSINLNSSNNNNEMCSSNNNNNNNNIINKLIIDGDKLCGVSTGAAGTMIGNKGDLLLQAIQRTGNAHSMDVMEVNKCCDPIAAVTDNNNKLTLFNKNNRNSNKSINSDNKCERSECDKNNLQLKNSSVLPVAIPSSTATANNNHLVDADASDCRECKRQKTKHNYSACQSPEGVTSVYRRTMSECMVGLNELAMMKQYAGENAITPSPIKNRKCMDANAVNDDDLKCGELKKYRRAFSEDTFNIDGEEEEEEPSQFDTDGSSNDDDDCITIKCHCPPAEENHEEDYKSTPVVNLQQINKPLHISLPTETCPSYISTSSSVSPHKKHIIVKTLHTPKINLTKVFSQQSFADDSGIGNEREEMDSPDGNNNQDDVFNFNDTRHRSQTDCFSYPPSSKSAALLQLSPRFIQSNAMLKRRSRHFSDRSSISERSSIGSDEHLSDEDYHYLMQLNNNKNNSQQEKQLKAPTSTSSLKKISLYKKFATKSQVAFNKLPLLGTLEESLLKNRLEPKSEVSGFNVLLGASGTFCPTQLTIPAQTFFYEFHGQQHMATPYVCELRLSRKGYSIPRTGTVQATLLNPLGTVVRMFVVPYDFRDMPAMSQTFIRQRVLALNDGNGIKNPDQLSTAEQMRFLRYAIHLRFQTGRSGRLCLHTDIKLLISRRTDCDTAAAHAKNSLESPSDLKTVTIIPDHPKYSTRIDK